jgi:hypothetical protein
MDQDVYLVGIGYLYCAHVRCYFGTLYPFYHMEASKADCQDLELCRFNMDLNKWQR